MNLPTSRKGARAAGVKYYFTGIPCKHSHLCNRYTGNGACFECDKIRVGAYYLRNKQAISQYNQQYRESHRETLCVKDKEYRLQNIESSLARSRKFREENPERMSELKRDWVNRNRSRVYASNSVRRSRERNAIPSWFGELDRFVIEEAYSLCEDRARCTGIAWHVDHMIPIAGKTVCGLHVFNNVQVIPEFLNLSKNNRLIFTEPMQWLSAMQ